ncbi:MAG: hypothetical protein SW833_05195 [Cyanobacteriota bacterium]|nr:hypothetical protein [Cyanobacteriota bacterium]
MANSSEPDEFNEPNEPNEPSKPNRSEQNNFLYPNFPYRGSFTPENLVFNANLQEFAQRVNFLCNLETSGKISSEEAYQKIKELWHQLKQSKKELGIGN